MIVRFYKYQGTGNDFILLDNRLQKISKNDTKRIAELCDRRFGIGADGFILLENDDLSDFKMVYFNADGNESTMCGNGARCITAFANFLGIIDEEASFKAVDGIHQARLNNGLVELQMKNVSGIEDYGSYLFLDTGSPHHVESVSDLDNLDVKGLGSQIRHSDLYKELGSNINFVEQVSETSFNVRTYERGVENETLSCGTGVTAVALAMHTSGKALSNNIKLNTKGGTLEVRFKSNNKGYKDIWLIGPAVQVFSGSIEW